MSYPGMHPDWERIGAFLAKMPTWWRVCATLLVLAWILDIAAWVWIVERAR